MSSAPSSSSAFGTSSSAPPFGAPYSTPALSTPSSTPATFTLAPFGAPYSTPAFSTPSSTPELDASLKKRSPPESDTSSSRAQFEEPTTKHRKFGSSSSTPFGASSTPSFGTPSSTPAFGASSTPAFGTQSSTPAFGIPSSTPAFGTPSSTPAFGTPSSTPAFGTSSSTPAFGTSSSIPAFGTFSTPSSTPAFGTPSSTPAFGTFGTPSSTPAFGTPSSTPAFGTLSSTGAFGTPSFSSGGFGSSLFSTQQQQPTSFGFGLNSSAQQSPFLNAQITTQMAPIAPYSLADCDVKEIVEAYKEDQMNRNYAFKHFLFSVTDQQHRVKPAFVSDIMWEEAMIKLQSMDPSERERLWPQQMQGFKDLSNRLKLQDEVLASDRERLKKTQNNVKMIQWRVQGHTIPTIERLRQNELSLQRRMLRVMRITEGLEGKGYWCPLMKEEAELSDKLTAITRQVRGHGAELSRRVKNLQTISRVRQNSMAAGSSIYFPGSNSIDEQSLINMKQILQQQVEAIGKLTSVLTRDIRDMEIMSSEDTKMTQET